jgi:hypothetical protein
VKIDNIIGSFRTLECKIYFQSKKVVLIERINVKGEKIFYNEKMEDDWD